MPSQNGVEAMLRTYRNKLPHHDRVAATSHGEIGLPSVVDAAQNALTLGRSLPTPAPLHHWVALLTSVGAGEPHRLHSCKQNSVALPPTSRWVDPSDGSIVGSA